MAKGMEDGFPKWKPYHHTEVATPEKVLQHHPHCKKENKVGYFSRKGK